MDNRKTPTFYITKIIDDLEFIINNMNNLTLEEFIEKVKDNKGKYIQNIIAIQGVINSDDIYYINNLMDTNY